MPRMPEMPVNPPTAPAIEERSVEEGKKKKRTRSKRGQTTRRTLERRKEEKLEESEQKINAFLEDRDFLSLQAYLEEAGIGQGVFRGKLRPMVGRYLKTFIHDGDLESVMELDRVSGIHFDLKPMEHAVQMAYGIKIAEFKSDPYIIREFQDAYGIVPDFQGRLEPDVQKRYAGYLRTSPDLDEQIRLDQRYTGVTPDYHGRLSEAVQDTYAKAFQENYAFHYRIGGVEPDFQGALKDIVEEREWTRVHILYEYGLQDDIRATGIDISKHPEFQERVQDAYKKKMEEEISTGGSLTFIPETFYDIQPDYEGRLRSLVQHEYRLNIRLWKLHHVISIRARTNVPPDIDEESRGIIQKQYAEYLIKEQYQSIKLLVGATDVEPDWRGELRPEVIKSYRTNLTNGSFHDLKMIADQARIPLDFEEELRGAVTNAQRRCIAKCDFLALTRLMEMTSTQPDFQGELLPTVRSTYKKLLRKNELGTMQDLEEVTGIPPDWGDELRQETYQQYSALLDERKIRQVHALMETSGLRPDFEGKLKDRVQLAFGSAIKHGRLEDLRTLERYSGQTPDYERLRPQINKAYKRWVARGSFEPIEALAEMSGIEPNYESMTEHIQKVYSRFLQKGQLNRLRSMEAKTGIRGDYAGALQQNVVNAHIRILSSSLFHARIDPDDYDPYFDDDYDDDDNEEPGVQEQQDPVNALVTMLHTSVEELHQLTGVPVWTSAIWKHLTKYGALEPKGPLLQLFKKLQNQPEAVEQIQRGVAVSMKEQLKRWNGYGAVDELIKQFNVQPERTDLLDALTRELSRGQLPPDLLQIFNRCNMRFELGPEHFERLNLSDPRTAAIVIKYGMPQEAKARKEVMTILESRGGWLPAVPELINICGPAARPEFCPWEQRLKPMLVGTQQSFAYTPRPRERVSKLVLDTNTQRKGFVEFVKRFGAVQAPTLVTAIIELEEFREGILENPDIRAQLDEFASDEREEGRTKNGLLVPQALTGFYPEDKRIRSIEDIDEIISDLERTLHTMRSQLLSDEIPSGTDSKLGIEILNTIVPRGSSYGQTGDRQALVAQWSATVDEAREHGRLRHVQTPEGYVQRTYPMRRMDSGSSLEELFEKLDNAEQNGEAIAEQARLLDGLQKRLEAADGKEASNAFLKPFMGAVEVQLEAVEDLRMLPARTFMGLTERLDAQIKERQATRDATNPETELKKRQGLTRAIENLELQRTRARLLRREDGYLVILGQEIDRLALGITERREKLDQETADMADDGKKKSKELAHEGWQKEQETRITALRALRNADGEHDRYAKIQGLLESLRISFGKNVLNIAGDEARQLTLGLMALEAPNHVDAIREAQSTAHGKITPEIREAWMKLIEDEFLLHFSDPAQAHQEVRNIPFTPELYTLIESIWRTTKIRQSLQEELDHFARKGRNTPNPPKHPFMDAVFEARGIEQEIDRVKHPEKARAETTEQQGVPTTFYPVHGLGRVLSGDIANACFDSQRHALATNQFPKLNAVLMGAKEGREERITGSFLLIEAAVTDPAESGQVALVIRALNPTEAGNKEFRSEDYVEQVIAYAIETAKARDLDQVRLCYEEHRGGHASNVTETINAMVKLNKKRKWPNGQPLENKPETNFNGYQIWRSGATRVVWRKEEVNT